MSTSEAVGTNLKREVREFFESYSLGDMPADLDERFKWLVEYQRQLHTAGLAVVAWPEKWGGRGLTSFDAIEVASELGRAGAPEVINFVAIEVIGPALIAYANEEQLKRWLVPMASADEVWCQLFSEPDAGSDLAALRTKAEFDGEVWRINGSKVWSTWGQFADKGMLLARTGPLEERHRNIGAFVIDMDQPGVEVHPLTTMTGVAEFAEVVFNDAIVRPEDVVGDISDGWGVTMRTLESERGPYALRRVSVLSAGMSALLDKARDAELSAHMRRRIVDAYISMRLLEFRSVRVADLHERGEPLGAEATLTKVALTDAEQEVFSVAHEMLGLDGMAWTREPDAVELYLYSRAASIYGGSAQIQRNVLGERYLGLPREPKA